MSAFIVSDDCIRHIIYNLFWNHDFKNRYTILDRHNIKSVEDFDKLAVDFYKMNVEAVKQRYNEKDGFFGIPEKINWDGGELNEFQGLKSMECLLYQCTEGNVPETELYAFLKELIELWKGYIISKMPEYEKAEWD